MDAKNQVSLDFANSPGLAELLTRKKSGDEVTLNVTFTLNQIDDKGVKGVITKIEYEDSDAAEEEKEVEPTADEPMGMSISTDKTPSLMGMK